MRWFAPVTGLSAPERPAGFLSRVFGQDSVRPAAGRSERLGGVPLGLAAERWPRCKECGKSQTLLAQLDHHPDRLDLGGSGRVLFVFQCGHDPGMCDVWDQTSGANVAFVVEAGDLGDIATPVPDDDPPLDPPIAILGWVEHEDGIGESEREAFMDDAALLAMSDQQRDRLAAGTRLGSVPTWIQSAAEAPAGWRFAGQLDSTDGAVYPGTSAPNFGDAGVAYLFLRDRMDGVPEARMFWQCC